MGLAEVSLILPKYIFIVKKNQTCPLYNFSMEKIPL
jgi:hypothetical protein